MNRYCADLHIHIGKALGKWVKITASPQLNLESILYHDAPRKGLDLVGVVDAGCIPVTREIELMVERGSLRPLPEGGLLASNGVLLIAACEVESREGVHVIGYLPGIESIKEWQKHLAPSLNNQQLSTQKSRMSFADLMELTGELDGIFCPAHAFTPHKGAYGFWTDRLEAKLGSSFQRLRVLELGLSADSRMAEMIEETGSLAFLSNSDAHSPLNIGREYNLLLLQEKNFRELRYCLQNQGGRKIVANFGLDPRLGKYHRSYCPACSTIAGGSPPVMQCDRCGEEDIIGGVYDRIYAIRDHPPGECSRREPAYHYRVPLQALPGIGPKTLSRLQAAFPHEIILVENTPLEEIAAVAGERIARQIGHMRRGRLPLIPGGGGRYGRVDPDYGRC